MVVRAANAGSAAFCGHACLARAWLHCCRAAVLQQHTWRVLMSGCAGASGLVVWCGAVRRRYWLLVRALHKAQHGSAVSRVAAAAAVWQQPPRCGAGLAAAAVVHGCICCCVGVFVAVSVCPCARTSACVLYSCCCWLRPAVCLLWCTLCCCLSGVCCACWTGVLPVSTSLLACAFARRMNEHTAGAGAWGCRGP